MDIIYTCAVHQFHKINDPNFPVSATMYIVDNMPALPVQVTSKIEGFELGLLQMAH